jgi:hypothetical protein
MSGNLESGSSAVAVGIAMIACFAATSCGGGGYVARHSPAVPNGVVHHPHPPVSAAGAARAQEKAKAEVTHCVNKAGATGMLSSSGRAIVIDCVKSLVPPDKQQALTTCLSHAAAHDKVYTASGRAAFESKDAPACLNAAR